jgi:hypothetical protein
MQDFNFSPSGFLSWIGSSFLPLYFPPFFISFFVAVIAECT